MSFSSISIHSDSFEAKQPVTPFSMISLFDGEAQLLLNQTKILKDIEIALMDLKTGGKTNLKAGFKHIKRITAAVDFKHYLHIITDGKLNAGDNLEDTVLAFQTYCKGIHDAQIIDAEKGMVKIGEAKELANRINANYEVLITENI